MAAPPDILHRPMASARLRLADGDQNIEAPIRVPSEAVTATEVLPAVRRLQDTLLDAAMQRAARQGQAVSCGRGCAACCRQPVALLEVEAWAMADLVERMPEPRRSHVRARFADALRRLHEAGLKTQLATAGEENLEGEALHALSRQVFALAIACPFLEDEACTIYADRPLACRQHLVTSPAAWCAEPGKGQITALPARALSAALQEMQDEPERKRGRRWIALTLVLEWTQTHSRPTGKRTGPAWIERLLAALARSAGTRIQRH